MRTILYLLFLCSVTFSVAQNKQVTYRLSSFSPSATDDDLKQLDFFFDNKQIIGVGESTHGTSEFTSMRHRLFKYLVENHQFNTFFLEADYSACKRVNRYIHGAVDNVDSALCDVLLWPWLTKEMASLIDWMREYNSTNDNKLNFVGCDMQLLDDERKELELFFKGNDEVLVKVDKMLTDVKDGRSRDSADVQRAFMECDKILKFSFNQTSNDWKIMKRGIDQWFEMNINNTFNHRDSCMAENMIYYTSLYPETKGMYFAHNWHVGNYEVDYKRYPNKRTTGSFLKQTLGDAYSTIAQTTYQAAFNVYHYQLEKVELEQIARVFNDKKSVEYILKKKNVPISFTTDLSFIRKNKTKITWIGAIAGIMKDKRVITEYRVLNQGQFDAIFFIDVTTATHLIKEIK